MRTRHITRIVSKPNPSVIRPNNRYGRHKLSRTMFIVGCCDWSCGNVNTCVWLMASVITLQLFIVAVMHITRIIPPSPTLHNPHLVSRQWALCASTEQWTSLCLYNRLPTPSSRRVTTRPFRCRNWPTSL